MGWLIFFLVIGVIMFFSMFFTVHQQTVKLVENWGRFARVAYPGLNFKLPIIERVAGTMSLRVQQLDVRVETKTYDNVFVNVMVSVQYQVIEDKVYEAFYTLTNAQAQITAFVFDVVRARVPKIKLDDVFEAKDEIANAVTNELSEMMDDFGYLIRKALVTDIDPDPKVKNAMNEINAAQRLRVAANEKGEAEKILKVKAAEADAESKALQGKGIADQRSAIINGLKDSVDEFQKSIPGTDPTDIMHLVMLTQYFDTIKELGIASNTNTIMLPHSPGAMSDFMQQMQASIIGANQATDANKYRGGH